jgi:hypothetical protein
MRKSDFFVIRSWPLAVIYMNKPESSPSRPELFSQALSATTPSQSWFRYKPQSGYPSGGNRSTAYSRSRPIEYYLTPAPNADVIRKPLLDGRHLIILNRSSIQIAMATVWSQSECWSICIVSVDLGHCTHHFFDYACQSFEQ